MNYDEPDRPDQRSAQDPSIVGDFRSGRKTLAVGLYPGDVHPGLLSGVGVDDQDRKFGVDKTIFVITATLIVGFVLWGILSPASVSAVAGVAFSWALENMGWLLNLAMAVGLIVMLYVAFGKYGKIKLGKDDEKPEFSRFSWIAMMFGAGLGVGLFFYGPSEPLAHFISPPPHTMADQQAMINDLQQNAGETPEVNREAVHQAVSQASYHWGLHIWSMYALVGGALAYATFRRGRPALISSIFQTLFGKSQTQGFAGKLVDIFAIIATLFGTATTLGLSAIQIGQGVTIVSGIGPIGNNALILIIGVLGIGFIISAVSGVARGIRYLSNINITFTLGLVLFVFFAGPTLYLLNLVPSGIVHYVDNYLPMMAKSLSWGPETVEFQSIWTAFYWAWWITWTPFVGTFIAKISRGRTLREFALTTMGVPTFILILAFTVFGGASIVNSITGVEGFDGDASPEAVLFNLFDTLPFSSITPIILMGVLAIFFITAADSASVVMGTMSSRGNPAPKKSLVVFWGLCVLGIAVVMLLTGGEDALSGLQSLVYLIALPFSLVLILLGVAFLKDLATDPARIRHDYAEKAMSDAIIRGIEDHGEEFEIAVKHSPDGRGAGTGVDASDPKYTDWYKDEAKNGNMKLVTGEESEPSHGDTQPSGTAQQNNA